LRSAWMTRVCLNALTLPMLRRSCSCEQQDRAGAAAGSSSCVCGGRRQSVVALQHLPGQQPRICLFVCDSRPAPKIVCCSVSRATPLGYTCSRQWSMLKQAGLMVDQITKGCVVTQ
jgi:hypothetical protein